MARQKGPDPATLAAHGVTVAGASGGVYVLTCNQCTAPWTVTPKGGRLAPLYWQCPNGCNVTQAPAPEPETEAAPAVFGDLASLPAILTPAEAAGLLRVSETTVKDWARAGDLPGAFKLGKVWRVERDPLLAYIRRPRG
jgi:excisionase family DNA binding protein